MKLAKVSSLTIRPPIKFKDAKDVDREVMGFNEDYWKVTRLKRQGWGIPKICEYFRGQYSFSEISYMIEKVVNVNVALSLKDGEQLREQMLQDLEAQKAMLYAGAHINSETGESILDVKEHKILLGIQDRIIALQGLNAPIKTEATVDVKINDARDLLNEKLNRFKDSLKDKDIIDVTPIESIDSSL